MTYEKWQQWGKNPETESRYNIKRVKGNLPEMESTKQLVKLISKDYDSEMKILDVGCNVGHYLTGLRKKFPELDYTGVDAYEYYINAAKEEFKNDSFANFEVKDILNPLFLDKKFDIVYSCNVILHLPDFRKPIKNLLDCTKNKCYIRMLLGDHSTIVKSSVDEEFDKEGNPINFWYLNTWSKNIVIDFISKLGWEVNIIEDEFNSELIQQEFEKVKVDKLDKGTQIVNGNQVVENIIFNWAWLEIQK
jgi:ubiquinone/menaquinone biosynthesis C-methylase UbiE